MLVLIFINPQEGQVTVDEINQQVAETYQIIASALSEKVERVFARKNHIALEVTFTPLFDVLLLLVNILLDEAEVYNTNPMLRVLVVSLVFAFTN